jgi:ATP-dependent Clp protease ATP-binding subunit ClpX
MESVMMDMMYEIPSDSSIGIYTVTKEAVEGTAEPDVVYRDVTVPKNTPASRAKRENKGEIA